MLFLFPCSLIELKIPSTCTFFCKIIMIGIYTASKGRMVPHIRTIKLTLHLPQLSITEKRSGHYAFSVFFSYKYDGQQAQGSHNALAQIDTLHCQKKEMGR